MVTAVLVPAALRFLATKVPFAPLNAPVPPVIEPFVTGPLVAGPTPYRKPPGATTETEIVPLLAAGLKLKYTRSYPTVLPLALRSVSCEAPLVLVKPAWLFVTEVNE